MRKNSSLLPLVAISAAFVSSSGAQAQLPSSGSLTAEVVSLRNKTGQVCFSLFDSSRGFPSDSEAVLEKKCISAESQAEVEADDLEEADATSSVTESDEDAVSATEESATEELATEELAVEEPVTEEVDTAVLVTETDEDTALAVEELDATEETDAAVSVTFESLPLGTYAVSVFHDENEDGEINRGGLGVPIEGFGFSKNPEITTRAPEFSETAVIVVGSETTTEIELIYY